MARILIISTIPATIKAFLLPYAEYFRANNWIVDGMADEITTCSDCRKTFSHVWDVNWSRNPLDLRNLFRAPKQLRELVKLQRFDLIHVHTPIASFVTRYALRYRVTDKRPTIIYTAHGFHFYSGGNPLTNALYLFLEKMAGNWTDYLVVMNEEDLRAARRYKLVPQDRLKYMPGIGVDASGLSEKVTSEESIQRIREELGLAPRDKMFLMVAEFIPRKRHCDAVRALALVGSGDVHLTFAGRGPLQRSIEKLAENLGVGNQVHFLGFRSDIPDLMRAANGVLLTSSHEGLPRSLMEALSLSIPCIGSDIRGTRDLLAGDCGLLFTRGDVHGLAHEMSWILNHPDDASEMGARGREKMKHYDIRHILKLHEDLYEEALSAP